MFNRNILFYLLTFSTVFFIFIPQSFAGNPAVSDEQMQQMMKNAQKMQECIAKIDQSAMQKLTEKSQKMQGELQALCAAGKRDEAQDKAIKFGKEISNSKEMQEMKKCGEMAQQMMQQMPQIPGSDGNKGTQHVCDVIN